MNDQPLTIAVPNEHEFAQYIRILGKGKKGSRSLSFAEAKSAMQMILSGKVEDVQIGAFLVLLRIKEETPEEIAGFVEAARLCSVQADPGIEVDLDWSSYAGKRKQLPWFILSALVLSQNGIKVFIHGSAGHTEGRIYTEQVMRSLHLPVAESWQQVKQQLQKKNLVFMPLGQFCAPLQKIIDLRGLLGLRSPVHTLARLLNPLGAPYSLQSVFHPAYAQTHQQAAMLLKQDNMAVLKGEGGEFERRPASQSTIKFIRNKCLEEETWARLYAAKQPTGESMSVDTLRRVWQGKERDDYAESAIRGTLAVILYLMDEAASQEAAMQLAEDWWMNRDYCLV